MSTPQPIKLDRDLIVLDTIARSPQSETYRGRLFGPVGFSSLVAVKRLHPLLLRDAAAMDALGQRSSLLGRIAHPNVVNLKGVRDIGGVLHLLFAYVSCVNLDTLMEHLRMGGHRVGAPVACYIARQMTRGLAAAQRPGFELIHGEVTPEAVLLGFDGSIQVCDFGLTKGASFLHRTQLTLTAGFGDYLAPERAEGAEPSGAGDNFGVGAILYELLTGRRLRPGDEVVDPSSINVTVPRRLNEVVRAAVARDPSTRPATAAELAERLEPFTNDDQADVLSAMSKTVCADVYAKELVAMERMWSLDMPPEERAAAAVRPPMERDPSGTDWRLMTPTLLDLLPDPDESSGDQPEPRADSRERTVAVHSPFLNEDDEDDEDTANIESLPPSAHDTLPPELANQPVALGPAMSPTPELSADLIAPARTVPIPLPTVTSPPSTEAGVVPDAVVSPVAANHSPWEMRLVRVAQIACLVGAAAIAVILLAPDRPTLEVEVRGAGSSVSVDGTHTTRSGLRIEGAAPGQHRLYITHDSGNEMTVSIDVDEPERVVVVIDD